MRGLANHQILLIVESVLSHVADSLDIDVNLVRETNLSSDGDTMMYGEILEDCTIRRCWNTLKEKCQYEKLKKEVNDYNRLLY